MSWLSRGMRVARVVGRRSISLWPRTAALDDVLPRAAVLENILSSSDKGENDDANENGNGAAITGAEEHEFEFTPHATHTSGESMPRIWANNPCKRLSSATGQYPELESNVGRIYPCYGPNSVVKSPSCVRLGNGLLVTARHAVPEVLKLENVAHEAHTRIPYQFANNAMLAKAPVMHLPVAVRLGRPITERQPDVCPMSNVIWETHSHSASNGVDVCLLQEDHPSSAWGLELSKEPLQVGEEVVLCAYIRPYLSWIEGWHWLRRANDQDLVRLDPELVQLKEKGPFLDPRQLQVDVLSMVCKPWARAMHQHCLRLAEDGNSYVTKIISHGKVLAVNDGLVAVDNQSTTYASGGAYVRLTDPTKLVAIHLGAPKHADAKYGNFNVGLRVDHPGFMELYNMHFKK